MTEYSIVKEGDIVVKLSWKACFRAGVTVILVFLFIFYFGSVQAFLAKAVGAAIPLLAGCVIAYVINILMMFYERHYFPNSKKKFFVKTRRPVCMIVAAISLVAIVVLVISLIVPQLTMCVQLLATKTLPDAFNLTVAKLEKLGFVPERIMSSIKGVEWETIFGQIFGKLSAYFGSMMDILVDAVKGVFSIVVGTVLSIIFAFYLLVSKDRLKRQCNDLLDSYCKPKISKKIRYIGMVLNESFHKYIVGQSTEAVIIGLLCMLGMKILGLPYESMIGALVAFTALIPIVGAYVGALVGTFIIAMYNPMDALVFLIFIIILQQIENNLIYPKVVGSSLGLPGMWVLAAVTIGGGVFGIPGMLFGVPLTAAIYRIVRHDVRKKIKVFNENQTLCVSDGPVPDAVESVSEEAKEQATEPKEDNK
ncbi:MAG: AI-2E family transporter [Ruminococcaceae bacterium]|nr:AI-2E family transporter [Oscillospiraceae bacterium]